jgi:hypothetical protein
MTFQLSLPIGARFWEIEINGVLFALLKCRAQQKKHRTSPDYASGVSSDTDCTVIRKRTYPEIPDEQRKRTKREK